MYIYINKTSSSFFKNLQLLKKKLEIIIRRHTNLKKEAEREKSPFHRNETLDKLSSLPIFVQKSGTYLSLSLSLPPQEPKRSAYQTYSNEGVEKRHPLHPATPTGSR